MRLSNKSKAPLYNFIHTLLIMLIIAGICLFAFEKISYKKLGVEENLLIIVPLFIITVFYLRGRQIFEYDSDGEALTIKNRHILPYFYKPTSDEFPKYKVISYNILDAFILKRLYLTIHSKKSTSLTLKYDISNLTQKETADLKHSLSKIANKNKNKESLKSEEIR